MSVSVVVVVWPACCGAAWAPLWSRAEPKRGLSSVTGVLLSLPVRPSSLLVNEADLGGGFRSADGRLVCASEPNSGLSVTSAVDAVDAAVAKLPYNGFWKTTGSELPLPLPLLPSSPGYASIWWIGVAMS